MKILVSAVLVLGVSGIVPANAVAVEPVGNSSVTISHVSGSAGMGK